MKILILSALYPPYAFGGAEDCAHSFANWSARNGHDVGVVMAGKSEADTSCASSETGVKVWRIHTPHIYPVSEFPSARPWAKPIWHLQDHVDPRTSAKLASILQSFAPDIIVVHYLQGFGYRALEAVAASGTPMVYVLHDLGLACVRMSMFKKGAQCDTQCSMCRISSWYKERLFRAASRRIPIGFVSPSQANLDTLGKFFPVGAHPNAVILNTKSYPKPEAKHAPSPTLRLLYAGKLDQTKGIHILAEAVDRLAHDAAITLTIAGAGPLEPDLREKYGHKKWFRTLGFVSQQRLADEMALNDLLCVPSLWQENSPGVVVHALSVGLPVIANKRGGMQELISDDETGRLVTEDTVEAWQTALHQLATAPEKVNGWRSTATKRSAEFDEDANGSKMIEFINNIIGKPRKRHFK